MASCSDENFLTIWPPVLLKLHKNSMIACLCGWREEAEDSMWASTVYECVYVG